MKKKSGTTLIDTFNKRHAAVMIGGKFAILSETIDPANGYYDVIFSRVSDMKTLYRPQKVAIEDSSGNPKLVNPIDIWLDSQERRQYKGIVFKPDNKTPDGYFNLFRGFAVEPVKGDYGLYRDHMLENICDGENDYFEWLFDWMADAVQNPADRPGTAVVLRGAPGTGKGEFTRFFSRIFGSHYVYVSGQHRFTGNFNNHLKMAMLVYVDEGFWAGNKKDAGTLKALVTEKTMLIEPKGIDVTTVENHMRVIMASNNSWIVPAEPGERRFFVLDVANHHRVDTEYFRAINDQMENHGGIEALMYDLMNREITSNLRIIPRNEVLFDQIVPGMISPHQWWLSCLYRGKIMEEDVRWPEEHLKDDIVHSYQRFCRGKRFSRLAERGQFFKDWKKICTGIKTVRRHSPLGERRPQCSTIPPLEDCRDMFEKYVDITIPWDDDEVPF